MDVPFGQPRPAFRRLAAGPPAADVTRALRTVVGPPAAPEPAPPASRARPRRRDAVPPRVEHAPAASPGVDDGMLDARVRWEQAQVDREIERSERLLRREARRQAAARARAEREQSVERRRLAAEVQRMHAAGWTWQELADVGMGPGFLTALGFPPVDGEPGQRP